MHSLEHGHTILWYDDTVKPGTDAYKDDPGDLGQVRGESDYFMAAPWKASDGKSFPSGKHLALTHWTGPENQTGRHPVLRRPQRRGGREVHEGRTPPSNAPEPGAP